MIYKLPENILAALLKYLESKPFKEVAPIINILTQLEKLDEDSK